MIATIESYFSVIGDLSHVIEVTDRKGSGLNLDQCIKAFVSRAREAHLAGNKLMFIGNGGSSTIASHMAEDYTKAGNIRAIAFNDPAFITCLGNDLGYEQVFSKQIEMFAQSGDILVAISSSGNSENILRGAESAINRGCWVLTLSGFSASNKLRTIGDENIFVPASEYGFVEIAHLTVCHAALDIALGLTVDQPETNNELRVAIG